MVGVYETPYIHTTEIRKHVNVRHKLDTDIGKYYQTLNDVVIPECMEFVKDAQGLPQRMKECIGYTTPYCYEGWNFCVELLYKTVADKPHQTEENLKKMRILRVLSDMSHSMHFILDDYADKAEFRQGKKIWASICEGGQEAAIYDTFTVNYLINCMLQRHFRNDPGFTKMCEMFSWVNGNSGIGQVLDILDHKNSDFSDYASWKNKVEYKSRNTMCAFPVLGLLHAGLTCNDLIHKTMDIFGDYGLMFQVWNDFMDFYSVQEESGKGNYDCKNNVKTWATITAMSHFNPAQAKEFRDCYGTNDPAKRSRVRELFDEIDLPRKYLDYLRNIRVTVEKKISELSDARVRDASTSYLEWLHGNGHHDVELEILKAP
nr:farnesyl pyrophosphate synthase [Halyomorpha halys]